MPLSPSRASPTAPRIKCTSAACPLSLQFTCSRPLGHGSSLTTRECRCSLLCFPVYLSPSSSSSCPFKHPFSSSVLPWCALSSNQTNPPRPPLLHLEHLGEGSAQWRFFLFLCSGLLLSSPGCYPLTQFSWSPQESIEFWAFLISAASAPFFPIAGKEPLNSIPCSGSI